jgi:hypothetical protein
VSLDPNGGIDPSKCYISKLPEDLLLFIFNFNSKNDLNEMKKTNRYINELIALKRKKLVFTKADIPMNILTNFLTRSPHLEELKFGTPNIIKSSDVFSVEQLNLTNLKVMDILGVGNHMTEKACVRLIRRCKNITELKISCLLPLGADFFFCLRSLGGLKSLCLSSLKELNGTDLLKSKDVVNTLAKHVNHLKLESLAIYELSETLTTAYSKFPETSEILKSLSFATVGLKDGIDLLNDLVFFTNLEKLAI